MRGWRTLLLLFVLAWWGAGDGSTRAEDAPPTTRTGTLTVHITGFEEDEGDALVQLANSRADYDSDDDAFRYASIPVANREVTAVFENVPYGEYGVKTFHDANRNRKLDIGFTGPQEAYGFSNGARGRFGPPDYDAVKFSLASERMTIAIEVQ
jgi:uncharacterized protein (DUF2141 family)